MTPYALAKEIYKNTCTSSASYYDDVLISDINNSIRYFANRLQDVSEESFSVPASRNLEGGVREYELPVDILNTVTKVELVLNGTRVRAMPLTLEPKHPLDEQSIISTYTDTSPMYFYRRGCIFILSGSTIVDTPDGLLLTYSTLPHSITSITDDTYDISKPVNKTEVGIPAVLHGLLVRLVSVTYKSRNNIPLNALDQTLMSDIEEQFGRMFQQDSGMSIIHNVPRGNYGYDL